MVRKKSSTRESSRSVPITNFFQRISTSNKKSKSNDCDSETSDSIPKTPPAESISSSRLNTPQKTPSSTQQLPFAAYQRQILEDDDDDKFLMNTNFEDLFYVPTNSNNAVNKRESSGSAKLNPRRRSKRESKRVSLGKFVPVAEAVSLKDNPLQDYVNGGITNNSYQFSLTSLLNEKKARDKKGYDIQYLEKSVKDGTLVPLLDELEDPYAEYDREETSSKVLSETQSEQLLKIFERDEQKNFELQLNFFEKIPEPLPVPALKSSCDKICSFLKDLSSNELKEVLRTDWITLQYELGWSIPSEVIMWLLDIVSFADKSTLAEAAFDNLKKFSEINARNDISNNNNDVQESNIEKEFGVPFSEILRVLKSYGCSTELLGIKTKLEERSLQVLTSKELESSPEFPYCFNVRLILRLLHVLTENKSLRFQDNDEIRLAIIVISRMILDRRLWSIYDEIEQTIASFLELFDEENWPVQAKLICEDITYSCGDQTQFKVKILNNFPVIDRGLLLRQILAFRFLFNYEDDTKLWNLTELDLTRPISLQPLLDLFQDTRNMFKIRPDTNYYELSDFITVLSFALNDDQQLRSEKDVIEEIIKKLNHLHGKIMDMRAAFLDRTKAKDNTQRLLLRLHYIINYRRTGKRQASILAYSPRKPQRTMDLFNLENSSSVEQTVDA
ncbi:5864_t:CDS:10 [Ambispora leptoticha]|uniref:5864_t:CDS:1 n=1 Tax=Ambispora leptoticha TaxID=144679 RepID=A0A9N8Z3T5_9GLOM|nr:5864_t:CDS:10 [Ambispora leptoticha]